MPACKPSMRFICRRHAASLRAEAYQSTATDRWCRWLDAARGPSKLAFVVLSCTRSLELCWHERAGMHGMIEGLLKKPNGIATVWFQCAEEWVHRGTIKEIGSNCNSHGAHVLPTTSVQLPSMQVLYWRWSSVYKVHLTPMAKAIVVAIPRREVRSSRRSTVLLLSSIPSCTGYTPRV
jgi:hypothetical protein